MKITRKSPENHQKGYMKITKKTIYELSSGKETIEAEVSNGRVTLINGKDGSSAFTFIDSDPQRVRRLGQLFIEASEL